MTIVSAILTILALAFALMIGGWAFFEYHDAASNDRHQMFVCAVAIACAIVPYVIVRLFDSAIAKLPPPHK